MVESDATKTSKVTQSDQFDQFWAIYPKKVGKKAALNIWTRLKPDKDLLEQILRAVEKQKKLDQWTKDGGQFIPNPATWLNQCRWEDELPTGSGKGYNQRGQSQPERERIKDDSEYEHETNAQNSPYFQAWYAEEQAKRARETREVTA
jgi:hypothetical protein